MAGRGLAVLAAIAISLLWFASFPRDEADGPSALAGVTEPLVGQVHPMAAMDFSPVHSALDRVRESPTSREPRMWLVRLRHRATGAPVPGATIYLHEFRYAALRPDQQRIYDANAERGSGDANLRHFAPRFVTDARGEARIPRVRAGSRITVDGDWYGQAFLGEDQPSPCEVSVDLATTLRLQAVDDRGNPVPGLRFSLQVCADDGVWGHPMRAEPSAVPSVHVVAHWDTLLHEVESAHPGFSAVQIATNSELLPKRVQSLGRPTPGDRFVRIEVGEVTGILVRVVDAGTGAHGTGAVLLLVPAGDRGYRGVPGPLQDGVAWFGAVAPGLRLRASYEGPSGQRVQQDLTAPAISGGRAEITLRF